MNNLEKNNNKDTSKKREYISFCIILGSIFGLMLNNIALGVSIGVVIGASIDANIQKKK